jgi:predicted transcriptional regulator
MSETATPPTEQEHHKRAFERYFAQGLKRSYQRVAEELGVSLSSVKFWSHKYRWQERLWEREAEVSRQVADRAMASEVADAERNLRIVRAALMKLAKGIVDGTIKPRIDDLPRLVQLEQELIHGPGYREGQDSSEQPGRVVVILPDNGRDRVSGSMRTPAPSPLHRAERPVREAGDE